MATKKPDTDTETVDYPKVTVSIEPDQFTDDPEGYVVAITAESVYDEFAGQVVFKAEDAKKICDEIMKCTVSMEKLRQAARKTAK